MTNYIYIGSTERFYLNILTDHGSLVAAQGDVMEFPEGQEPTDGLWVVTPEAPTDIPFRPWPPVAAAKEVNEPEPEPTKPVKEPKDVPAAPPIPNIYG